MADKSLCTIPNCGKPAFCRSWCRTHYRKTRRKEGPRIRIKTCQIPGCGKSSKGIGLCSAHYSRMQRHGHPLGGGPSPQTKAGEGIKEIEKAFADATPERCWIWPYGVSTSGYGKVYYLGAHRVANRVVCELFHGSPPTPAHQAAHLCGVRACINKHHIVWKTPAENCADRVVHGTVMVGERNHFTKLTAQQVLEIRHHFKLGVTREELAERFGVGYQAIYAISVRRNWKHI